MTIGRIGLIYLAASLVVVIAGLVLEELPFTPGGVAYAFAWIVLGPLISLFYVLSQWKFALIFYPVGSAFLVPGAALILNGRRVVRVIGYVVTVIMWALAGFVALAAAWGA